MDESHTLYSFWNDFSSRHNGNVNRVWGKLDMMVKYSEIKKQIGDSNV